MLGGGPIHLHIQVNSLVRQSLLSAAQASKNIPDLMQNISNMYGM